MDKMPANGEPSKNDKDKGCRPNNILGLCEQYSCATIKPTAEGKILCAYQLPQTAGVLFLFCFDILCL